MGSRDRRLDPGISCLVLRNGWGVFELDLKREALSPLLTPHASCFTMAYEALHVHLPTGFLNHNSGAFRGQIHALPGR